MHPRIQEVLEYLDTTRSELSNAVDAVPADRRAERPTPGRWSAAEVLEHLNIIEGRVAQMLNGRIAAARAAGVGPELETGSVLETIDRVRVADRSRPVTAPEAVQPQTGVDAANAWSALEQARAGLRTAVLAGDGLALAEIMQPHPALGLINLYQWIVFVGAHEARHTAQVREIAAEFGGHSIAARIRTRKN
jgi:DinB superfamily